MRQLQFSLFLIASILLLSCAQQAHEKSDPLPSWNEGKTKQAIVDFVNDVTNKASTNFVKPADRIATFDNDGTLWSEQPLYFQFQFVFDRVKAMAEDHPEWKEKPLIKAVLDNDIHKVLSFGERGVMELVMTTSTGMTTDEFSQLVKKWIMTAKNPATQKLYKDMVFQPMLELLDFLRASGFKTYIVSGGEQNLCVPGLKKSTEFHLSR